MPSNMDRMIAATPPRVRLWFLFHGAFLGFVLATVVFYLKSGT